MPIDIQALKILKGGVIIIGSSNAISGMKGGLGSKGATSIKINPNQFNNVIDGENKIRNQLHEVKLVCKETSKSLLTARQGGKHSVGMEIPPGYGDKELTVTHNHSNSLGRKSEGTYSVKVTSNADYKRLSQRITKDEPKLRKQLKEKYDSVKIVHGTNSKRTRQETVGVADRDYKEILSKYGFTYARDKKGR
ncbi:MAG: hypothetical protein FWG63_01565 [Defluviitaleaceae bacterium]|nr:hypothetical protein [Defluviitaleaceae bacterium]